MTELVVWRGSTKSCVRRGSFVTRKLAITVAAGAMMRMLNKGRSVQMSVYCCIWCKRWHIIRCKRTVDFIPEELKVWDGKPTSLSRSEQDALLARMGEFSCQPRS
jgi:hypothetical protein